jgi:cbb3-type cytochrome oxidase subunit 1
MAWWVMLGWLALVVGVAGYVVGLRRSRRNDELARGLILWMALAWLGVAVLLGAEIA